MEADGDRERPVATGVLLFPPAASRIARLAAPTQRHWQPRYCMLFKASEQGIERLEVYESEDEAAGGNLARALPLEGCVKIYRSGPVGVVVVGRDASHELRARSEDDAARWARALQTVAFETRLDAVDEDNELYCSSGEGVFAVTLCESPAALRCGLAPDAYTLVVGADAIELRDERVERALATWPYRYIRRYGYRRGRFTFEAGRKCDTGEGAFHVEHANHHEIFRCVSLKMKSMKRLMVERARGPAPPQKPPRTTATATTTAMRAYDRVEVRSEAWRTLGIDRVDHVEFPPRSVTCEHDDAARPIVVRALDPDPDAADYDRLQHFGSTSRLNRSDGYEPVVARSPFALPADDSKPSWSDYDEVENAMRSVRLADDSYLGYGQLRRVEAPPPAPRPRAIDAYADVERYPFDDSYAIVSKPKRV